MILRLALRSLVTHPIRSGILAAGFGLGVSVMASLLGIGQVILEQARSPALVGGGDVLVTGATGTVGSARFVLSSALGTGPLAGRVRAASPTSRARLYLVREDGVVPIGARGGIPSLERALDDPETGTVGAWVDTEADRAWADPPAEDVLRAMDRFHPVPDVPERAASWAEWLYFNGQAGDTRFYLTFLVGPRLESGRRAAGVRLQLARDGERTSFADSAELDAETVLATAPDLTIGRNRVRLDGREYRIDLDLPEDGGHERRARGRIVVGASPGRSLPPLSIRGAGGWVSGYVVPVMSGALSGSITVGDEDVSLAGGTSYHDHNWGFWEGVSWQWGQVHHEGLSFVYGRVQPPADAADAERLPRFLAALGPEGPIAWATDVSIDETDVAATGRPEQIVVEGRGAGLDLTLVLTVQDMTTTRMGEGFFGEGLDFLQLRGPFRVSGVAGDRRVDFTAPGAAETFRGR